jgi:hypothetical protein
VEKVLDNNTFLLQNLEGEEVFGGPVNGHVNTYFVLHCFIPHSSLLVISNLV